MANVEFVIEFNDDFTSISYKGRVYKEASLLAFTKKGKNIKMQAFGNQAKKMLGKNDGVTWIESPFKYGTINNMELAQLFLSSFIDFVIEKRNFATKIKALFVCSCALDIDEKRAFEILAIKCGINQVWFVPSVITYAVGNGADVLSPTGNFMVGIGAGCTEIACVSQGSIVNGYNIQLGGSVIDSALIDCINENFGIVISNMTAEHIKNEIGSLHPSDIANIQYQGIDALTRVSKSGTVFAKDLYPVFSIAYDKICEAINIVISQLSADLINDIAKNGIYVFGSASKVTGLESFLRKRLNIPVNIIEDEMTGVKGGVLLMDDKKLLNTLIDKN